MILEQWFSTSGPGGPLEDLIKLSRGPQDDLKIIRNKPKLKMIIV